MKISNHFSIDVPNPVIAWARLTAVMLIAVSFSVASWAGAQTTPPSTSHPELKTPQQVTPGLVLGINDSPEWTAVGGQAALMAQDVASNTKFVRIGADWNIFQPTSAGTYPTGYSAKFVGQLDKFFQLAAGNGVRVLLIAAYAPSWANGGSNASGCAPTSAHYTDYAAYCEWLLRRYAPYMDSSGHRTLEAIELWNEPDVCDLYFRGKGYARESPAGATAYGKMVVTAGSALKTLRTSLGCADVQICAPAISDPHEASWSASGPHSGWIDAFYAVPGVTSDYDIFSWHSYWSNLEPENRLGLPPCWNPANQTRSLMGRLTTTAAAFDPIWPKIVASGDSLKPNWLTETGACALSNTPLPPPAPPHSNCVLLFSEEPALLADAINTLVSGVVPNLKRVYWFRLTEMSGYGLLDGAGKPKLTYATYQKESKSGALLLCAHVTNGGFETPATSTSISNPTGTGVGWTFTGTCGVQRNGSPWGAIQAPEGLQTAYVESTASMSQSVYFPAGNYIINFLAARRGGHPVNPIQVRVDGAAVGRAISPGGISFAQCTSAQFSIRAAGNHTVTLAGTARGRESDTFVDDVCLAAMP